MTIEKLNQKVKQTSLRCFFTCEIKKTVTNWNRKCFWTSVVYILWNGLF